jgi:HD-like signal output (HDOD) protein
MKLQLTQAELHRLLPSEPGLSAHCHRVAALSGEISRQLCFSYRSNTVLEQAALLHHLGPGRRLEELPEATAEVLQAFHHIGRRTREKATRQLAEILVIGNVLDEQIEMTGLIPQQLSEIWYELRELAGLVDGAILDAAAKALGSGYRPEKSWAAEELAVNSVAAREVFVALRGRPECDVPFLARLASKDPGIAGNLIQAANSAIFARRTPVKSIPQAVAYIGTEHARKVLLALALKPLFASARLSGLWQHSVRMAEFCASLAGAKMPAEEALLMGLVHDIGRIAVQQTRGSAAAVFARLLENGCPPAYIERLLYGSDHAKIGASILTAWNLPASMVEAVGFHHRPADTESEAAAFLYMADFWLDPDEDLSSARHFQVASRRTGFSMETLSRAGKVDIALASILGAVAA